MGPTLSKLRTEKHAEFSGRNSEWSHLLQVMAENHIGPGGVNNLGGVDIPGWREESLEE